MNQQLVDAAPGEIRPSVVVLQQSTKTLATAMEAGDSWATEDAAQSSP